MLLLKIAKELNVLLVPFTVNVPNVLAPLTVKAPPMVNPPDLL